MNREILFRGKREDGLGDWVYGYLIIEPDGTNWIDHYPDGLRRTTKVIPSTVGQFTGLTDKNGVKIFEGDLCAVHTLENSPIGVIEYIGYGFVIRDYMDKFGDESLYHHDVIEVVGNIHDNTELIKQS